MIRYINLINFRGLTEVSYNFGLTARSNANIDKLRFQENVNTNIIYGKNTVGKTRFLSSFKYLKNILFSVDTDFEDAELFFSFSSNKYIYNVELETTTDEIKKLNIRYSENNTSTKSFNLVDLEIVSIEDEFNIVRKLILGDSEFSSEYTSNLLSSKRSSLLLKFRNVISDDLKDVILDFGDYLFNDLLVYLEEDNADKKFSWTNELVKFAPIRIQKMVTEKERDDRLKYQDTINKILPEIDKNIKSISFGNYKFESQKEGIDYFVQEEPVIELTNGYKLALSSEKLSMGIKRIIYTLENLIWLTKSTNRVLLIDEFDPFVHDFLYLSIIRTLMANLGEFNQIITISHNSTILNSLHSKNIIFMDEVDGKVVLFNPPKSNINYKRSNILNRYLSEEYISNTIFDSDIEKIYE